MIFYIFKIHHSIKTYFVLIHYIHEIWQIVFIFMKKLNFLKTTSQFMIKVYIFSIEIYTYKYSTYVITLLLDKMKQIFLSIIIFKYRNIYTISFLATSFNSLLSS